MLPCANKVSSMNSPLGFLTKVVVSVVEKNSGREMQFLSPHRNNGGKRIRAAIGYYAVCRPGHN